MGLICSTGLRPVYTYINEALCKHNDQFRDLVSSISLFHLLPWQIVLDNIKKLDDADKQGLLTILEEDLRLHPSLILHSLKCCITGEPANINLEIGYIQEILCQARYFQTEAYVKKKPELYSRALHCIRLVEVYDHKLSIFGDIIRLKIAALYPKFKEIYQSKFPNEYSSDVNKLALAEITILLARLNWNNTFPLAKEILKQIDESDDMNKLRVLALLSDSSKLQEVFERTIPFIKEFRENVYDYQAMQTQLEKHAFVDDSMKLLAKEYHKNVCNAIDGTLLVEDSILLANHYTYLEILETNSVELSNYVGALQHKKPKYIRILHIGIKQKIRNNPWLTDRIANNCNQTLVACYSSFERFNKDLFCWLIGKFPSLLKKFKLDLNKYDVDDFIGNNPGVWKKIASAQLGDTSNVISLIDNWKVLLLAKQQKIFKELEDNTEEPFSILPQLDDELQMKDTNDIESKDATKVEKPSLKQKLIQVSQLRHMIVHNNGKVITNNKGHKPSYYPEGSFIKLSEEELDQYVTCLNQVAYIILIKVEKVLTDAQNSVNENRLHDSPKVGTRLYKAKSEGPYFEE